MSLVNSTKAEKDVKKLAKLASNCVCPNCGCEQGHGFGAVCMKFHTFVCNNCKVSHGAVSHRCKSLTMSLWNDAEVTALRNAGNDACRATYLANAPPPGQGGRPHAASDIATFKRFIVTAYEHKQYNQPPSASSATAPSPPTQPPAPTAAPAPRALPRRTPAAAAPAAPLVDLLSFRGTDSTVQEQPLFDAFGTSSTVLKPPTQQKPPQASSSFASFPTPNTAPSEAVFDPFNNNTTSSLQSQQAPVMTTTATPTAAATSTPTFDPFNNNMPSSSSSSLNHATMNGNGLNNGMGVMNGGTSNMMQNGQQNLNNSPMVMNNNNPAMYGANMNGTGTNPATMMYNMNNNNGMMNNGMTMMNGNPMMMNNNNMMMMNNGNNHAMMNGNTMNNGQHNTMMSTGNNNQNMMGGSMMGNNGILSGQPQSSTSTSFNAFGNNSSSSSNNINNKSSTTQSSQANKPDPFASLFN